jgi:hypothetical protein
VGVEVVGVGVGVPVGAGVGVGVEVPVGVGLGEGGGVSAFKTLNVTTGELSVLPLASVALAYTWCVPSATEALFHDKVPCGFSVDPTRTSSTYQAT